MQETALACFKPFMVGQLPDGSLYEVRRSRNKHMVLKVVFIGSWIKIFPIENPTKIITVAVHGKLQKTHKPKIKGCCCLLPSDKLCTIFNAQFLSRPSDQGVRIAQWPRLWQYIFTRKHHVVFVVQNDTIFKEDVLFEVLDDCFRVYPLSKIVAKLLAMNDLPNLLGDLSIGVSFSPLVFFADTFYFSRDEMLFQRDIFDQRFYPVQIIVRSKIQYDGIAIWKTFQGRREVKNGACLALDACHNTMFYQVHHVVAVVDQGRKFDKDFHVVSIKKNLPV